MNKLKIFIKNPLVRSLAAISVLSLLLLWLTNSCLKSSTNLGEQITVPDFTGMQEDEVKSSCENRKLRYEIEKVAYNSKMPRNCVIDQIPASNSKVKNNRIIYLTINADKAPLIPIKDLSQIVERQAVKILENSGFEIDPEVEYTPDPAQGWVIEIKHKGQVVPWDSKLPKGSKLTLVLGDGSKGPKGLMAQDYRGIVYNNALHLFRLQKVMIGRVDSVNLNYDLSTAIIYKQNPSPGESMKPNDPIDIWITDSFTFNSQYKHIIDAEKDTSNIH